MIIPESRIEVMQTIEQSMDDFIDKYLKPIEKNWQPSDFLPDTTDMDFADQVEEIQGQAKEMDYDLFVVLIGDCVTEEALPSYESWLMSVVGVDNAGRNGWSQWVRAWTAEENRHGDLLNKYLYLSGRVNMREFEITVQYLLNDGFDIGTDRDPYRNFVYTSFQELATNISHRRVASQVKKLGNKQLAKMCGVIAADEMRHANAYSHFVQRIFEIDPSEMMLAFEDMMRKKIVMPAVFLRQSGQEKGDLFSHFSFAAQRVNVYTTQDYIDILAGLVKDWDIENISGLNDAGKKARDYLVTLAPRLRRIAERAKIPTKEYEFKWVTR